MRRVRGRGCRREGPGGLVPVKGNLYIGVPLSVNMPQAYGYDGFACHTCDLETFDCPTKFSIVCPRCGDLVPNEEIIYMV